MKSIKVNYFKWKILLSWGTRVAQSVGHMTLDFSSGCDLSVMRLSPTLGSALCMVPAWDSLFFSPFAPPLPPAPSPPSHAHACVHIHEHRVFLTLIPPCSSDGACYGHLWGRKYPRSMASLPVGTFVISELGLSSHIPLVSLRQLDSFPSGVAVPWVG